MSDLDIDLNKNWFLKLLLLLAAILGQILYYSTIHIILSLIRSVLKDESIYCGIFKLQTTLVRNLLNVSAIFSAWSIMELFSAKVISLDLDFLSVKKCFTYFQKDLLSIIFYWSRVFYLGFLNKWNTKISQDILNSTGRLFKNLFPNLVQSIISFEVFLFINGLWFDQGYLEFIGALLSKVSLHLSNNIS